MYPDTMKIVREITRGTEFSVSYAYDTEPIYPVLTVVKAALTDDAARALEMERLTTDRLDAYVGSGSEVLRHLFPSVVSYTGGPRPCRAYRYMSGFSETLATVRAQYPDGVDPRHGVWLWKRGLDLLTYMGRARVSHHNLSPHDILVHPRDHAMRFCGWSHASREPSENALPYYTKDATDAVALARCVHYVLGGNTVSGKLPEKVPAQMAELVYELGEKHRDPAKAWDAVDKMALGVFGRPTFVTLEMNGWKV